MAMSTIDDLYQETIIEAARDQRHKGAIAEAKIRHTATNASCGDSTEVFIQLDPTGHYISELKWQGNGCIISQAALSSIAAAIQESAVEDVQKLTEADVLDLLGLASIAPARKKCLGLGLRVIQEALNARVKQH